MSTPAPAAKTAPSATAAPAIARKRKPKLTFMLHDPNSTPPLASLGKYVSTDFRYAALKVASRGHTKILLRRTNTKLIYEFTGSILKLDTPQVVARGERTITYYKKPVVKFVKKYVIDSPTITLGDDPEPSAAEPAAAAAP